MAREIDIHVTSVFDKTREAYDKHPRFISSCGGTRSGKTYAILQLLWATVLQDKKPTITSVVSETMPHLKRGAIRDFQAILGELWDDNAWNKTDCIYTFPNKSIIEFFSVDSPAKVHGPARDRLFVNESQNVPYDVIRQLLVRTQDIAIFDYNPTHSFWLNEKIETQDNCITIRSTYKDNDFLTPAQVTEIESNKNDKNWWRVYGEGKVGVLEGVIYNFEQIDTLPEVGNMVETFGLDFGFSADPSVLVHTLIDKPNKKVYFDEVFYRKGMLNADMAAEMEANGVPKNSVPIYADCAEPKTIEELYQYGFNVLPCYKATRKAEQVQMMRGYKHYITKRSVNGIREHRGYVWAQDKEGNNLNEPIAFNDHFEDAARYSVISHLVEGQDRLCIGFGDDY